VVPPLSDVLALHALGDDTFSGTSHLVNPVRVFGGQVLAQALVAASRTVADGRPVHSLHAYFLRAGNPAEPLSYAVSVVRDGRRFATRRVVASQGGKELFELTASFHLSHDGVAHQLPTAPAGTPDDLPEAFDLVDSPPAHALQWWAKVEPTFPFDVRFLSPEPADRPAPRQRFYLRARAELGDDPVAHAGALAYASDVFLLGSALPPHGLLVGASGVLATSLDHAMWVHAPFRADDWLLYDTESSWAGGGRALCRGHLFDPRGVLVATVMQEGLLTGPREESS
jgi:acyl-CoA thioesterase-2